METQQMEMVVIINVISRFHRHVVYQVTWYQIHDLNHISNVLQTSHTLPDMQHHGIRQVQMLIMDVWDVHLVHEYLMPWNSIHIYEVMERSIY